MAETGTGVETGEEATEVTPPQTGTSQYPLNATNVANKMYHWHTVSKIVHIDVFDGTSAAYLPTHFITGMQRLLTFTDIRQDSFKIFITLSYMAGEPRVWAELLYNHFKSFEDFRKRFLIQFWNSSKQRLVRWEMYTGKWSPRGTKSKVNHFTDMVIRSRTLLPRPSEIEIMYALSEHFPPVVRDRILYGSRNTIRDPSDAREELKRIEEEDRLARTHFGGRQ